MAGSSYAPPVPTDIEVLRNIEVLAAFVAKYGPPFEQIARTRKAHDPKFAFLFGGRTGTQAAQANLFYNWKKLRLQRNLFAPDSSDDVQRKICMMVQDSSQLPPPPPLPSPAPPPPHPSQHMDSEVSDRSRHETAERKKQDNFERKRPRTDSEGFEKRRPESGDRRRWEERRSDHVDRRREESYDRNRGEYAEKKRIESTDLEKPHHGERNRVESSGRRTSSSDRGGKFDNSRYDSTKRGGYPQDSNPADRAGKNQNHRDDSSKRNGDDSTRRSNDDHSKRSSDDHSKRSSDDYPKRSSDDYSKRTGDDYPKRNGDDYSKRSSDDSARRSGFPPDINSSDRAASIQNDPKRICDDSVRRSGFATDSNQTDRAGNNHNESTKRCSDDSARRRGFSSDSNPADRGGNLENDPTKRSSDDSSRRSGFTPDSNTADRAGKIRNDSTKKVSDDSAEKRGFHRSRDDSMPAASNDGQRKNLDEKNGCHPRDSSVVQHHVNGQKDAEKDQSHPEKPESPLMPTQSPPAEVKEISVDGEKKSGSNTGKADDSVPKSNNEINELKDLEPTSQETKGTGEVITDQHMAEGNDKQSKEALGMKLLKAALADYVKEVLKPAWKEGTISKDSFKAIVKKVVDKVSGSLQGHQIPKSQENVDQYMTQSHAKIAKLVHGYVDKFKKT